MDRVLEAPTPKPRRSSKKEEYRLLFPGEKAWEFWALRPGKEAVLKSSVEQDKIAAQLKTSHDLALPLQHLLIFPLWLATTDASLMKDMVSLQLESRGLGRAAADSAFNYAVVRQENERSLLSVTVLSEHFPAELNPPKISNYRPATDYWKLPLNQLVLWRELNAIVVILTSGQEIVYLQSSPGESLQASLLNEAHCARLVLENDGAVSGLQGITVFGNFPKNEIDVLSQTTGLPVQQLDRPQPVRSKNPRSLLPPSVQGARLQQVRARSKRNFLWIAGGLYLLIAAFVLGQLAWLSWTKSQLQKTISVNRQEVDSLRTTSKRWQSMELALLPDTYPVEMLYRSIKLLPDEGVRFLTYDQDGIRILITGEAKSAPAAFQYVEALKKSPDLDAYSWEMPPPKLLPNDSAQFQIEGKRRDATPKNK